MIVIRLAVEHGLTEHDCLHGTGLLIEDLRRPGHMVTAGQEIAVIANVLRALGDSPGLGFTAGLRYHSTAHGIWGYALLSSPSLRGAINVALRYLDLSFSMCEISPQPRGEDVGLVIVPRIHEPSVARFVAERDIGIITTLVRDIAGPEARLRGVRLPYPEPDAEYSAAIGAALTLTPEYGCRDYEAVFDGQTLDDPLPQGDPTTAVLAEQQCRELLEQRRTMSGIAGRVRDAILAKHRGRLTEAEVASALHLSARSLRRRLSDEGSTFRALLDDVRGSLAEELLARTDLSIAEIADRVGYAENASFTRAFQRRTGMPPFRWRALLAGSLPGAAADDRQT